MSERDPDHSIIEEPWLYETQGFNYQNDPDDWRNSYIDLTLRRGDVVRRLRFLAPKDLKIEPGFPVRTGGMVILDVSARQMEDIRVRVDDFEGSWGAATFWARDVLDLDQAEQAGVS